MKWVQLSIVLVLFNGYALGAEHVQCTDNWWLKAKCLWYTNFSYHSSEELQSELIDAIDRHSIVDVKYLLKISPDRYLHIPWPSNRWVPIIKAVTCNAPSGIVRLLCEAKANVNERDDEGNTLFQIAMHNDNVDTACVLLTYGDGEGRLKQPSDSDSELKSASFVMALVNRSAHSAVLKCSINHDGIRKHLYDANVRKVATVLNDKEAPTYRIPAPLNDIIAQYAAYDFSQKVE